jgi:hypothetical protein
MGREVSREVSEDNRVNRGFTCWNVLPQKEVAKRVENILGSGARLAATDGVTNGGNDRTSDRKTV